MKKIDNFLINHGTKIVLILLVLVYFKSCSLNSDLKRTKKEIQNQKLILENLPSYKDLEIEGLKSEKRMIQSTDRRILDVNRQTQIDEEIKKLKSK